MNKTDNYYPEKLLEQTERLDLKEFWHTMVRRKRLILLFIAVIFLLSLIITLVMKPVYRASTLLEIERKIASVTESGFVNGDDPRDTRDFYQTQYELIKSRSIASKVIKKLNLADDISNTGVIHQLKTILHLTSENDKPDLESTFIDNITIEPVNTSRLVLISYDAEDPKVAANVVNEIAHAFINRNTDKYKEATTRLKKALDTQISNVQKQLSNVDKKITQFKKDHAIAPVDENGKPLYESKLQQLTKSLGKVGEKIRSIEITLTAEQKQNPPTKYKNALLEEKSLRLQIQQEKDFALKHQDSQRQFERLLEEQKALQATNDNLLQRLKQFNIASPSNSQISIVDLAIPPKKKNKPKLLLNLFFGTMLGFLFGTAYAFLIEYLDDTITNSDELERITKLPNLGIIPTINDRPPNELGLLSFHEVHSYFAEAFRTFRTSIKFLTQDNESKVIFITSTRSGEGKSTAASNLATVYAQSGRSVLLIDADLRNPSIHKIFHEEQENGLSELLLGDAEPKDVIKTTDISDLYLITSGKFTHDPIGLISNLRMEKMLKLASGKYDHVIIDGAPVLGLADALILSNLATATIFVIQSGETDKNTIISSINRIKQAKGNLIGTLLTSVDMDRSNYAYNYLDYNAETSGNAPKLSKVDTVLKKLKKL